MSRDKQIDDLAEKIREIKEYITDRDGTTYGERYIRVSHSEQIAKHLLEVGYRKASDVAREIFEEIENNYADFLYDGYRNIVVLTEKDFEKLKKKYTEGEG